MYRLTVAYFEIQPITLTRSTLDGSTLPTPLPPHVQPQYYAAIIAAEAIGNSGNTRVVELNITDTSISGYAFYQGNQLTKAIMINSLAFFTTTTTPRSSTHVDLNFTTGAVPLRMDVKRLFVAYVQFFDLQVPDLLTIAPTRHADDTSGLTWGGQTYETADARVSGSPQNNIVDVKDGIDIQATEVVMLTFFLKQQTKIIRSDVHVFRKIFQLGYRLSHYLIVDILNGQDTEMAK